MSDSRLQQSDQYKGWLYKWTNYIRGYQKRWFVLQNGLLSYYRNQAEMAHTCRGTITLGNAFIHTEDSCSFVISSGATQVLYLKASSEVERQRWVTALELAKSRTQKLISESEDDEAPDGKISTKDELAATMELLSQKLEDLGTCNDLINKHGTALQRSLSELEEFEHSADMTSRIKTVNERANLFKITSNAMINACADYLRLVQVQGPRWVRLLSFEHDQRLRLEEMVEHIAKQNNSLERQARHNILHADSNGQATAATSDDDEFYDAKDQPVFKVALRHADRREEQKDWVDNMSSSGEDTDTDTEVARVVPATADQKPPKQAPVPSQASGEKTTRRASTASRNSTSSGKSTSLASGEPRSLSVKGKHRTSIPEKPHYNLKLWSFMRNCIGKELSKIPMPVNFNEPISMLQRITEELEYCSILDKGAACEDSCEQLAHVAAFTVSAYATTNLRSGKPFNPMLGETFEFDRFDELGWRTLFEQVRHHPPTLASHTEGQKGWVHWQEFTMTSRFRGKYLQLVPQGVAHLKYIKSGNHYTWRKVTTTVHNFIVGKLWVDNHGEMEIFNHKTKDRCHLKYSQYSFFSKAPPRQVTGVVTDAKGVARYVLNGTWSSRIEVSKVIHIKTEGKGKPVFETEPSICLWEAKPIPPGNEKMYNFSQMAIELNEPDPLVAPTDSRNRPDQRLMENRDWDKANKVKEKLEEKQRQRRKEREAKEAKARREGKYFPPYEPTWFRVEEDPITDTTLHCFRGGYWEAKQMQEWDACPEIYL